MACICRKEVAIDCVRVYTDKASGVTESIIQLFSIVGRLRVKTKWRQSSDLQQVVEGTKCIVNVLNKQTAIHRWEWHTLTRDDANHTETVERSNGGAEC